MINEIGERIINLQKKLGVNQGDFSKEINISQSVISRVESGKRPPSKALLNAMKIRYSVNPKWVLTGEGSMFLTAEDYIEKGIEIFGERKMSEGLIKVFKNPRFTKFHSLVKAGDLADGGIDVEVMQYLNHVIEIWDHGDEKMRHWLEKQLKMAVREIREKK